MKPLFWSATSRQRRVLALVLVFARVVRSPPARDDVPATFARGRDPSGDRDMTLPQKDLKQIRPTQENTRCADSSVLDHFEKLYWNIIPSPRSTLQKTPSETRQSRALHKPASPLLNQSHRDRDRGHFAKASHTASVSTCRCAHVSVAGKKTTLSSHKRPTYRLHQRVSTPSSLEID